MDINQITLSLTALGGVAIICGTTLAGWRGWLRLKTVELDKAPDRSPPPNTVNTRIELADLKERLRKLEAIAAGVEL